MANDNLYGFESTESVEFDRMGLPLGTYKALAVKEEPAEKDDVTTGVIVTYEVLEGEHKGKQGKVWYSTLHSNQQVANIAKQQLKRLAEATGRAISSSSPIKNRVLTLEVGVQKKDERYTEIKRYWPENHQASDIPF